MSSLDDTITDPLSGVERQALTELRQHEAAIDALRDSIATVRQQAAGDGACTHIAELRRLAEEGGEVEALLSVPREVLLRETLAQAQWPAADLMEVRAMLAVVDAFEAATERSRAQIGDDDAQACAPDGICDAFDKLLSSWTELQAAGHEARQRTESIVSRVDLALEARASTIRPLCDALLDKLIEEHERLAREARLEGGGPGQAAAAAALPVLTRRLRALLRDGGVQQTLEALQVEIPAHSSLFEEEGAGAAPLLSSMAFPKEEAAQRAPAVAGRAPPHASSVGEDPLAQTAPLSRGGCGFEGSAMGGSSASGGASSAELWHAVHVGDTPTLRSLIDQGSCSGQMRDASGHSVLWHAIAFNHMDIANLMLDTFPPGKAQGVDMKEIHPRKEDTLLHLLCYSKHFAVEMANLFKRVAAEIPKDLFHKVNRQGFTFFQVAASSLNFWVLTFMLRNFKEEAKALTCMDGHPALTHLAEVIPQPMAPVFKTPEQMPEHFRVADMLQPDESGIVPYADIAFDVGMQNGMPAGRFLAHRIVVGAQSPVIMEALETLPLTSLHGEKVQAAVFRVDPRISQEVWRSALQFMYTGVISCSFGNSVGKVIELLRACVLYKLPKPLMEFAQSCLYPLLPSSPPTTALQAFSICAGSAAADEDLRPAREASAYILLRSAHKLFSGMELQEAVPVVARMVQTAEHAVFNPPEDRGPDALVPEAAAPMQSGPAAHDQLGHGMHGAVRGPMPQQAHGGAPHDILSQSARDPQGFGCLQVPAQEAWAPTVHVPGRLAGAPRMPGDLDATMPFDYMGFQRMSPVTQAGG